MIKYRPYTGDSTLDIVHPLRHDPKFLSMVERLILNNTGGDTHIVKNCINGLILGDEDAIIKSLAEQGGSSIIPGELHINLKSLWMSLVKIYISEVIIKDVELINVLDI